MKIIEFYEKTKLDFELMNLLIIDIYEKMLTDTTGTLNKKITSEILMNMKTEKNNNEQFRKEILSTITNSVELYKSEISTIKQFNTILTNEVSGLRDIILKLNSDLTNSIIAKLFEIKQMHVEELKNMITTNETTNNYKLIEMIEKENNKLSEQTLKTIIEIIPKSQLQNMNQIETLITKYQKELNNTIQNENKMINIEEISQLLETKYNILLTNIQKTLSINLNSTEERINKNITDLKEFELIKHNNQDKINDNLTIYLNKFKNSTIKGRHCEAKLMSIIQEIYPLAEIIDTSGEGKKCDIMIKRENKPIILIENKTIHNPVDKDDIKKFCRDIEYQKYCGIMFSQTSNISTKENFQIDIINNLILLYVSNCNYDYDKIKMAISIVDHLYPKITENTNNDITIINNDIMTLINDEYKKFLNQRDSIKNYINDTNKKLINQLYDMEFPNLNNILLSKYTITHNTHLTCDICKRFIGVNKKSLTKHKQSCRKKNINNSKESVSDENSKDNNSDIINDIHNIDTNTLDKINDIIKSSSDESTLTKKKKKNNIVV